MNLIKLCWAQSVRYSNKIEPENLCETVELFQTNEILLKCSSMQFPRVNNKERLHFPGSQWCQHIHCTVINLYNLWISWLRRKLWFMFICTLLCKFVLFDSIFKFVKYFFWQRFPWQDICISRMQSVTFCGQSDSWKTQLSERAYSA